MRNVIQSNTLEERRPATEIGSAEENTIDLKLIQENLHFLKDRLAQFLMKTLKESKRDQFSFTELYDIIRDTCRREKDPNITALFVAPFKELGADDEKLFHPKVKLHVAHCESTSTFADVSSRLG